jgi:UDP-N-acetylglucosamine 2-epimerase (non-hydrolysing)
VLVGNTMIDTLLDLLPAAEARDCCGRLDLAPKGFVLVTLHRPALVDDPVALHDVLRTLETLSQELPVVFPVHPRTRARMADAMATTIRVIEPLDYLDFVGLEAQARLVITDSGGVQEETSALGVACLTYRTSTERPITITHGTNRLVKLDPASLLAAARAELRHPMAEPSTPIPLWDGRAGVRAAAAIAAHFGESAATRGSRDVITVQDRGSHG